MSTPRKLLRAGAIAGCIIAPILIQQPALAGVKLITLPVRERVDIQLDHPTQTLVEEERIVTLNEGFNDVVFAFTGTTIDVSSLQLRILKPTEDVNILSMSFPPDKTMVTWQVSAAKPLAAHVRISYLIGGLNKSYAYRAVADKNEGKLVLRQYLLLHNNANEAFGEAGMWTGFGERFNRPIGINETKRVLANKFSDVNIRKVYTADVNRFGYSKEAEKQLRIPMHYELVNTTDSGLGSFPLTRGKARIFQEDGHGTSAFLGEDWMTFTPQEDRTQLFLGEARDVVVKRKVMDVESTRVFGNVYNFDIKIEYEIENFKPEALVLDMVEHITSIRNQSVGHKSHAAEWEFLSEGTLSDLYDSEKSNADKVVFRVPLPAVGADQKAKKITHVLHIQIKNEW